MTKLKNSLHFFLIILFFSILISRFLIYLPVPGFLSIFLNEFVPFQNFFLIVFNFKHLFPIILFIFAITMPILLLKFPELIYIKENQNIRIRFWLNLIFFPILIFGSLFLDANPFLTFIFLISIPLFLLLKRSKGFLLFLLFLSLPFSSDLVDCCALVLWILMLYLVFK